VLLGREGAVAEPDGYDFEFDKGSAAAAAAAASFIVSFSFFFFLFLFPPSGALCRGLRRPGEGNRER
jgi:hypothetical protein